jgi:hypothetical protein
MNIPRPLLIVIVVIVILGVVSCGAGVFRGLNEDPHPAPEDAGAKSGFDGLIKEPVPLGDIKIAGGDCSFSEVDSDGVAHAISVPSSCFFRVEPKALIPRVLKLEATSGSAVVSVQQTIDGKPEPSPPKSTAIPSSGDLEISVSGSSPVEVTISCAFSCILRIKV